MTSFERGILEEYLQLSPENRRAFTDKLRELVRASDEREKEEQGLTDEEIDSMTEAFRRQLQAQRGKGILSSSTDTESVG